MAGETGKGLVPWRPPFSLLRGPVAAYLLVGALTAGAAALVYLYVDRPPSVTDGAAMATGPARPRISSLKLPFRRPDPLAFRTFSLAERDDMIEDTPDGRLPKVSSTGWMPWIANARRFDAEGPAARVGLLMINVGADQALMERAIEELPGDVSLAFLAGTPDLPKWMKRAHARDHETYLMMPVDEPDGVGERGIRPIDPRTPIAENVRRLRAALARGEGYVGVVMSTVGEIAKSDDLNAPLTKEIADRGLGLIEIDPGGTQSPMARLAAEYGVGYARTSTVLDYKLARNGIGGNLDRLTQWTGETWPGRPPRHDFGVLQPDAQAIDAIVSWRRRLAQQTNVALVPVIGHFECRTACMTRLRAHPDQLRP